MLFFIKLLFILFLNKITYANHNNYVKIFNDTLLSYNIVYYKLDNYKAGAICIPYKEQRNEYYHC